MTNAYNILIGVGLGYIAFLIIKLCLLVSVELFFWIISRIPDKSTRNRNRRRKKLGLPPIKLN